LLKIEPAVTDYTVIKATAKYHIGYVTTEDWKGLMAILTRISYAHGRF
jgi:hypothetical protein